MQIIKPRLVGVAPRLRNVTRARNIARELLRQHAIGTNADFTIYQEQFWSGAYEHTSQNTALFNEASGGAFQLVSTERKGNFVQEQFVKMLGGIVNRRVDGIADVTDISATSDENINVKVKRRIGPMADTRDKWRSIGSTLEEMSFILGGMAGEAIVLDMVNTAVAVLEAALQGQAAVVHTAGAVTLSHGVLVDGMAKFGDRASALQLLVMHSKPHFDLVKQAITDKIFGVANVTIYEGTVGTFGRRQLVIDAPSLVDAGAPNTYNTLLVGPGAVTIEESEQREVVSQTVTGKENLVERIQGEYAFNVGVRGFKYNTAAGANPTDAALATPANWIKNVTANKDLPGVRIVTQ
jgi:hypothetical protein